VIDAQGFEIIFFENETNSEVITFSFKWTESSAQFPCISEKVVFIFAKAGGVFRPKAYAEHVFFTRRFNIALKKCFQL